MTLEEYADIVYERLRSFSAQKRTGFATVLAERMLPLYLDCDGYDWCRPDLMKTLFGGIWGHVTGRVPLSDAEISELEDRLLESCPNFEECAEYDAGDACRVIGFALDSTFASSDAGESAAAARIAIENGRRHSDYTTDEERFSKDPRIMREVEIQRDLLDYLEPVIQVNDAVIGELRRRALGEEKH